MLESAVYYTNLGLTRQAVVSVVKAIDEFSQLLRTANNDLVSLQFLAESLLLKASLQKSLQLPTFKENCQLGEELLRPVVAVNKSPEFILPYARILSCLGDLGSADPILVLAKKQGLTKLDF